ncbi:hypothetical protein [Beijerinckia mobilis]|nr:hypothetical protein [Beijerinckia mobilis]
MPRRPLDQDGNGFELKELIDSRGAVKQAMAAHGMVSSGETQGST